MAHKAHPKGFRIRGIQDWLSRGFFGDELGDILEQDHKIRSFLDKKLREAGLGEIVIERSPGKVKIIIPAVRPGLVIGRGGEGIERLRRQIKEFVPGSIKLELEVVPIKEPWTVAKVVAEWIAQRLEKRFPHRTLLKQALSRMMSQKQVKGARVQVSGRLGGADIARTEWLKQGELPRQTLRSDLDYAQTIAVTKYGAIGVKVWIYKGEKEI